MKTTAILEGYDGPLRVETERGVVVPNDVTEVLRCVDGDAVSAAYFEREGDVVLTVAGGPDRFQVSLWNNTSDTGREARDQDQSGEISLVISGQRATLPRQQTLGTDAAIKAVQGFVETGTAHPDITWEAT